MLENKFEIRDVYTVSDKPQDKRKDIVKKYNGILEALIGMLSPQMGAAYTKQLLDILDEIDEIIEDDGGR